MNSVPQNERVENVPTAQNRRLLFWAAGLCVGALVAHAIDVPDHLKEWWGYAAFFVTIGSLQFFFSLILFIQPWRYDETGSLRTDRDRYGRPFFVIGIVMSAASIIVYIISRTSGLPFLGGKIEPVTVLSLLPVVVNIPLIYFFALLIVRSRK